MIRFLGFLFSQLLYFHGPVQSVAFRVAEREREGKMRAQVSLAGVAIIGNVSNRDDQSQVRPAGRARRRCGTPLCASSEERTPR